MVSLALAGIAGVVWVGSFSTTWFGAFGFRAMNCSSGQRWFLGASCAWGDGRVFRWERHLGARIPLWSGEGAAAGLPCGGIPVWIRLRCVPIAFVVSSITVVTLSSVLFSFLHCSVKLFLSQPTSSAFVF